MLLISSVVLVLPPVLGSDVLQSLVDVFCFGMFLLVNMSNTPKHLCYTSIHKLLISTLVTFVGTFGTPFSHQPDPTRTCALPMLGAWYIFCRRQGPPSTLMPKPRYGTAAASRITHYSCRLQQPYRVPCGNLPSMTTTLQLVYFFVSCFIM